MKNQPLHILRQAQIWHWPGYLIQLRMSLQDEDFNQPQRAQRFPRSNNADSGQKHGFVPKARSFGAKT